MKNFVEELKWRGMLQEMMPGTEEQLNKEMTIGYVGFDPTSDSLGIGNMVQIMTLLHFQKAGHKPIAVVGGATGMVGDPSGKNAERNLLSLEDLERNLSGIKKQLEKFLDFGTGANSAEIVNNYDWFKSYNFLEFIRDIGKHITVNYMMSKDSVKNRLENGMSFTEFSYQLIQGYDFYYLNQHKGVKLQMGGSDQWGNIVTGTELIRRKNSGEAYALTTPLIKKADGTKFGKTESGNIWLDAKRTSPYKFYQFWLNASDIDAETYIKIFTLFDKATIDDIIERHKPTPHLRLLQKELAKDITTRVHSAKDYEAAVEASDILFKGSAEDLGKLDEETFLDVFEGVPQFNITKDKFSTALSIIDLFVDHTAVFPSKGEARKMIQGGGVQINKNKVEDVNATVSTAELINGKYLLAQKGKKNYYLIIAN